MQELKEFFIHNWQLIASAVLFIVSFIIGLITRRKKGYTFSDIIIGLISEQLPEWIKLAEASGGSGEQKKVSVLNSALNYASKTLGRNLSEEESSFIIAQASRLIENILATPQTKQSQKEITELNKKSKYR